MEVLKIIKKRFLTKYIPESDFSTDFILAPLAVYDEIQEVRSFYGLTGSEILRVWFHSGAKLGKPFFCFLALPRVLGKHPAGFHSDAESV